MRILCTPPWFGSNSPLFRKQDPIYFSRPSFPKNALCSTQARSVAPNNMLVRAHTKPIEQPKNRVDMG